MKSTHKLSIISVLLTSVLVTSSAFAGLSDPPKAVKSGKTLEQLYEEYKNKESKPSLKTEAKSISLQSTSLPATDYEEINVLQEKLSAVDPYLAEGRAELENFNCNSTSACKQYYAKLQIENKWYEAVKKGYASKGCEPNRKLVLMSDEESVYYQSADPMLGKDEAKLLKSSSRIKDSLKQNKRFLAESSYAEDVCGKYAKDVWTTQNSSGLKALKIKKQEF